MEQYVELDVSWKRRAYMRPRSIGAIVFEDVAPSWPGAIAKHCSVGRQTRAAYRWRTGCGTSFCR
jgi:hypothetical protein